MRRVDHQLVRLDRPIAKARRRLPAVSLQPNVTDPLEIERLVLELKIHAGIHTFPNHAPGSRYLPLFREKQILCRDRRNEIGSAWGDVLQDTVRMRSAGRFAILTRPGVDRGDHHQAANHAVGRSETP
ncbi:hypothetical protein B7H23_03915 [Notoacmeibacter marinus]|uniref:Uncharacterized protein n=2 Tax=Notoacmeibacter marinus TaxID=1876515 RepID=A0A231V1K9_9HYPH|nr:hypothetical protein B7H23_03915 [Notoacmeibacter marinus]